MRALDLSVDGPMLGQNLRLRPGCPRRRRCVSGEGEAPLELLLAAAACAASTDVCGVPVVALRGDASPTQLDLSFKCCGDVGARLLALLVSSNGVLRSLNLTSNRQARAPPKRERSHLC